MNPMDPRPRRIAEPVALLPIYSGDLVTADMIETTVRDETPKEIIARMLQGGLVTQSFSVEKEFLARSTVTPEYFMRGYEREVTYEFGKHAMKRAMRMVRDDYQRYTIVNEYGVYMFNRDELGDVMALVRSLKTDQEMVEIMAVLQERRDNVSSASAQTAVRPEATTKTPQASEGT